ncbi:hypothetical protein Pyn_10663 [Prunus yedoensis var. nudiflora]|uniref:Uncharacterized protein n=1 Tax=Prunus yedoensis var. nudiflora TaxID=2094558 RepID=A0A314Z6V6_PRUYE|nr:hypothetical protein Pyn_10663 [Prunus yedoensis var. nudiflora]
MGDHEFGPMIFFNKIETTGDTMKEANSLPIYGVGRFKLCKPGSRGGLIPPSHQKECFASSVYKMGNPTIPTSMH